jgi:rod shape-determining protein MreB
MLNDLLGAFSYDIGIDLGTANTLVFVRGKGIVINEPSVVAINNQNNQILAIGRAAQSMVGKTPSYITAHRPLVDGVVSDFEITEAMLKYFIDKVHEETMSFLPRPRCVIGIPSGVTDVEKRAVEDAAKNAGARAVFLIEEPMAAAIGAGLPIQAPAGNAIVDIGGGTSEIAVISLGGIVESKSIRIAGDQFNSDIIQYVKQYFNIVIGERSAERIKIEVGAVFDTKDTLETNVSGRDVITGLPRKEIITNHHIKEALEKSSIIIAKGVQGTLERTPPELISDIIENGIMLAGGGALLRGMDHLIMQYTEMPVVIAEDPLTGVSRGTGIMLEDLEKLKHVLVNVEDTEIPH